MYETLGDYRWTARYDYRTWIMAETGYPPERTDLEYNTGNSGGGFDNCVLSSLKDAQKLISPEISKRKFLKQEK